MTDNIINLADEIERRTGPAPEHVERDQFMRPMYRFSVSFDTSGGRVWSIDIWAYDLADAEARLEAIRSNGRVDGQIFERGPL